MRESSLEAYPEHGFRHRQSTVNILYTTSVTLLTFTANTPNRHEVDGGALVTWAWGGVRSRNATNVAASARKTELLSTKPPLSSRIRGSTDHREHQSNKKRLLWLYVFKAPAGPCVCHEQELLAHNQIAHNDSA